MSAESEGAEDDFRSAMYRTHPFKEISNFSNGAVTVEGLEGLDLVGGDVVEVTPPFDPTGNTALVGATMMYGILCVLADSVA